MLRHSLVLLLLGSVVAVWGIFPVLQSMAGGKSGLEESIDWGVICIAGGLILAGLCFFFEKNR
jgi:hypothetical protein